MDILKLQRMGGADYFQQKLTHEIGPRMLQQLIDSQEEVQLVDVRQPEDFACAHIGKAVNLPFAGAEPNAYIYHLSKHIPVVVYSYDEDCTLALEAAYLLARNGYPVRLLMGGFAAWRHYGLPIAASVSEFDTDLRPYQAVDNFIPPETR
ncbi:MAG TPA: rhodanese-like domain-containing protein [Candidatus Obscuribacterales bacterium]